MLFRVLQCTALAVVLVLVVFLFEAQPMRGDFLAQTDGLRFGKVKKAFTRLETEANATVPTAQPVVASRDGGIYEGPFEVEFADPQGGRILYTLDGTEPREGSPVYRGPVRIDSTRVLKYRRAADPDAAVQARTYVLASGSRLPVLSLTLDPVFLHNRHSGIYVYFEGRGRKWQRPAQVEYFEQSAGRALRFPAELRIHGHWTRELAKKSFQLIYRPETLRGHDSAGILAAERATAGQKSVILRAAGVDASYRLGDELFRSLYAEARGIVTHASRAMLLLNGESWGLYNVHEKIDEDFLRRRFGPGDYEIIKYERTVQPVAGSVRGWNELLEFFAREDFRREDALARAAERIDLDNFTDYWLFNIYAAHIDWPHNNAYAFRKIAPGERWRWIAWDADATFETERGLKHDTLAWASRTTLRPDLSYGGTKGDSEEFFTSTLILSRLLRNRSYEQRFVSRFCQLMRSQLARNRVSSRFDALLDEITPYLQVDWQRWADSRDNYANAVTSMRTFIAGRHAILFHQFGNRFGSGGCPANSAPAV